jgi:hypothetical protein
MKCAGKICEKRKRWQPKRGSTLPRIHITPEEVNLQRYAQPTSPPVTVSVMVDDGLESMDEARLLPIIIDKQQCRFGAQVRYDSLQGCHLCCIRVDDPYYKTYTCQRKVSQVVAIFFKLKCYNIADLSVSSFAKTYKLIAIENWQRILTFVNDKNDRRKRQIDFIDPDKLRAKVHMARSPPKETEEPSKNIPDHQNDEPVNKHGSVHENALVKDDYLDITRLNTPGPGTLFVRVANISNIPCILMIKEKVDGVVRIIVEDDKCQERIIYTTADELKHRHKHCFPNKHLNSDSNCIPSLADMAENLLVFRQIGNDRRRLKMHLMSEPRQSRLIQKKSRSPASPHMRKGAGNQVNVVIERPPKDQEAYIAASLRYDIACTYESCSLADLDHAATSIQKHTRRHQKRYAIDWKREKLEFPRTKIETHCATLIQRVFRGHLGRTRAVRRRMFLEVIQMMQSYKERNNFLITEGNGIKKTLMTRKWTPGLSNFNALLRIEAWAHRDYQYGPKERVTQAATIIQSYVRRYQARHTRSWRETHWKMSGVFAELRMEPTYAVEAMNVAACVIQQWIRAFFAKKTLKHMMKNLVTSLAIQMDKSATKIQKISRGMLAKNRVARFKAHVENLLALQMKDDLRYTSKTLYHVFPNLEIERPWTPVGGPAWVLPRVEEAAVKIQCLYRKYAAKLNALYRKRFENDHTLVAKCDSRSFASTTKLVPQDSLSWDFLWDFEVAFEANEKKVEDAACIIQRSMRRFSAARTLHWRRMLKAAKTRKMFRQRLTQPPGAAETQELSDSIFNSFSISVSKESMPYVTLMTKKSVLRSYFENAACPYYEQIRNNIQRCALLVAPLEGLLRPKRYRRVLDLIDRQEQGVISRACFREYVRAKGSQSIKIGVQNRPMTPSHLILLPADRSWMITPTVGHKKYKFNLTKSGLSTVQPTIHSPGAYAMAQEHLRDSSIGYQRLLFARQRRRWVLKCQLLPADRYEMRLATRKKCFPSDIFETEAPCHRADRKVMQAISRSRLLPLDTKIDFKAQSMERLIARLSSRSKLMPCDKLIGDDYEDTETFQDFIRDNCRQVTKVETEGNTWTDCDLHVDDKPSPPFRGIGRECNINTVEERPANVPEAKSTSKILPNDDTSPLLSKPKREGEDELVKQLRRERRLKKLKKRKEVKESMDKLTHNLEVLERQIMQQRKRSKKRGKKSRFMSKKREIKVNEIFEWTKAEMEHEDDTMSEDSSDEDEPLVGGKLLHTENVKKKKIISKSSNKIFEKVRYVQSTGETLKSLVEDLEHEFMANNLEKWEKALARRERLVTPKTNEVKYVPTLAIGVPVKLSPIVKIEGSKQKGKYHSDEWRVSTPSPIFNETISEAKGREKKANQGYSKVISKARKSRRLQLYESAYLSPLFTDTSKSPRGSATEAVKSLRKSSAKIAIENEGLYLKAWRLAMEKKI